METMLSKSEWDRAAEVAAAHKYGEDHAGWYVFRRYGAKPTAVVGTAVALGLGARWIWRHAGDALPDTGHASLPMAFWPVFVVLLVATAIAFRPRPLPTLAHVLIVKVAVFGLLWLGLAAFGVSFLF